MNWDALGAIAELVGAGAVVASLIYLSVQIRHNSQQVEEQVKALHAQSLTAIENAFSRFRQSIIQSREVASVWRRALTSFEELAEDEKVQADVLLQEFCWAWETTITRMTRGDYTQEGVDPYIKNLMFVMSKPGAQQWWVTGKREYSDDFVALVERALANQSRRIKALDS